MWIEIVPTGIYKGLQKADSFSFPSVRDTGCCQRVLSVVRHAYIDCKSAVWKEWGMMCFGIDIIEVIIGIALVVFALYRVRASWK